MLDPQTIRNMADAAARKAARQGKRPYVFWDAAEIDRCPPWPLPFIGDYVPRGWKRIKGLPNGEAFLFVDSGGYGEEGELALTQGRFKAALKDITSAHPGRSVGFAIIEAGEFQVCVGAYLRKR